MHSVSNGFQSQGIDKRSYACAAACISVSRNLVHITTGMYKKGLLNGSYWFAVHASYFAILTLVFYVFEHSKLPTAEDAILMDALEGRDTLAGLCRNSLATQRCARLFVSYPV